MGEPATMGLFGHCSARGGSCAEKPGERCVCGMDGTHQGRCRCWRCDLPFTPEPPSGPVSPIPTQAEGRYARYRAWLATDEGRAYWSDLVREARTALKDGARRFSTRTHVAGYRAQHRVRLNDRWSAWLADDLVAEYPELLDLVERRTRKKAKA